ncbi:unnamed protein product, partial [Vitis vinifera]
MLEPPIITVNTVLSLLAVDYPANKLSCYVSDDGASPLTFYALLEASKFSKLWVPFCKKYGIQTRAPFRYFSSELVSSNDNSMEFLQEYRKMKERYEELRQKIEDATLKSMSYELSSAEFVAFSNVERENHPTIIKVILENKETRPDGLPHLVYVSREKHPRHPHHYKAGAMNVLTRVSGVMTNAPFMLNVDCDMYAKTSILYKYVGSGIAGLQGPMYGGTGCFHRRKVIYGLWPEGRMEIKGRRKLTDERLEKTFGNSKEFTTTAARILSGLSGISHCPYDLLNRVEAAQQVATCSYEYGTSWGTKIGWLYGTTAEDILTGMRIHAKGWRSTYCQRDPPAFLGCVPSGGPVSLTQRKRWATGLLEVQFSKNSPFIATLTAKLQFRQCLAYMWILSRGRRSIPELGYIALPAYCIMARSHFLPKVQEPAMFDTDISLYHLPLLHYWNTLLGLSKTIFEVTKKDQSTTPVEDNDKDAGRFTFDESLIFVLATTLALLHLVALVAASIGPSHVGIESRIGEVICSVWLVLCFFPFLTGLFGKGKYGIPTSTICKSAALALLFLACIITRERKNDFNMTFTKLDELKIIIKLLS